MLDHFCDDLALVHRNLAIETGGSWLLLDCICDELALVASNLLIQTCSSWMLPNKHVMSTLLVDSILAIRVSVRICDELSLFR